MSQLITIKITIIFGLMQKQKTQKIPHILRAFQKHIQIYLFFDNMKDAMKYLQGIKFNLTYVIVSGSLFPDFISELEKIKGKISICPKIIIFTSESRKEKIKNMKEINDSFYNIGGITVSFEEVTSFLNKNVFGKELNIIRTLTRKKIQTGGDFSFQLIEKKSDLIGPVYLNDLIIKPYKLEYAIFDKYLIDNYEPDWQ